MSEFPKIRASNDGVEKVVGAVKDIAGGFSKAFGAEAREKAKSSANLSSAQAAAEANLAATQKLMKTSAKLDRKQIKTEGKEVRKTQKSVTKQAMKLDAKTGSKISMRTDGKGAVELGYTKAARAVEPAVPAGKPETKKPAGKSAASKTPPTARKGKK